MEVAKGEYLQFLNSGDWLFGSDVLADVFKVDYHETILYGISILIDGVQNGQK